MAIAAPPRPSPSANTLTSVPATRWKTTPGKLQTAMIALWAGAFLLWLASFVAAYNMHAAVQTVGKDSVPSIIAAQKIKASLADMDANVVNQLIVQPGRNASSIQGYDADRQSVVAGLVKAAENITYGDAERKPITDLQYGLGSYEEAAAQAQLLHQRSLMGSALAYHKADQFLAGTLLPAADALTKANSDALESSYSTIGIVSVLCSAFLLVAGFLLLAILAITQMYLSNRMRRTTNPPLAAATILAAIFLFWTLASLGAESHHLKVAKVDAFTSLSALWQARAVAYDANTDESRWLLDKSPASGYQQAFYDKSAKLAAMNGTATYDGVAQIATAVSSGQTPSGFTGYLADELRNITFPGEGDAAKATLANYARYYAIDQQIRNLDNSGNHVGAINLDIGMATGQSNWAYSQFDSSLGDTIKINQDAFDNAVNQAFGDIAAVPIVAPIVAVLIAALAVFGLMPRIQEYRV